MYKEIKRPSLWLHLTDFWRALVELFRSRKWRKRVETAPVNSRYPVLVIPGFTASPRSTYPLRNYLHKAGYDALDWRLGLNLGRLEDIDKVVGQIDSLYQERNEKIAIIGWSLGGIYARRIAMVRPEKVRNVITLGSPYRHVRAPNYAAWLFNLLQKIRRTSEPPWVDRLAEPLVVRSAAIYSKIDGIVPWEACHDPQDLTDHLNIEVNSSHFGYGFNREVIQHIRDFLDHDMA